jgi:hypothetical protein
MHWLHGLLHVRAATCAAKSVVQLQQHLQTICRDDKSAVPSWELTDPGILVDVNYSRHIARHCLVFGVPLIAFSARVLHRPWSKL